MSFIQYRPSELNDLIKKALKNAGVKEARYEGYIQMDNCVVKNYVSDGYLIEKDEKDGHYHLKWEFCYNTELNIMNDNDFHTSVIKIMMENKRRIIDMQEILLLAGFEDYIVCKEYSIKLIPLNLKSNPNVITGRSKRRRQ